MEAGSSASNPWCIDIDSDSDSADDKKNVIMSGRHDNTNDEEAGDNSALADELAPATDDIDADSKSAPIVANVYVYAIGEYYDIQPLKARARRQAARARQPNGRMAG
jgi:hypothetical protein